MSVRVPLWAGAGKFTFVETGATKGAMIGRDLFNADGTLFVPAPTPTPGDPPTETRVAWSALIEVPANIQSITALSGDGFVRRAGTGFSASPLVTADLPDVANTGAGTLLAITRDAKGRVSGSRAATTTDLAEGANLYHTGARAAAAAPVQSVAGRTGAVSLVKADVGLGSVDNTSDTNKPVSVAQQAAIDAKVIDSIADADTAHAPSRNAVFDALALKAAIPKGYIDGLQLQWVSGTALTVSSGAAYIEVSGNIVSTPSAIAKTGLTLTASTWYHVYLFLNAGTPDVEVVTAAPATAYSGTARSKAGDTTRRYIGSIKTDASGAIYRFAQNGMRVSWYADTAVAPFRALLNGTSTSALTVSLSSVMPVTALLAQLKLTNLSSDTPARFINSESGLTPPDAPVSLPPPATTVAAFAFIDFPTDHAQALQYFLVNATAGSGAIVDVIGYIYER